MPSIIIGTGDTAMNKIVKTQTLGIFLSGIGCQTVISAEGNIVILNRVKKVSPGRFHLSKDYKIMKEQDSKF